MLDIARCNGFDDVNDRAASVLAGRLGFAHGTRARAGRTQAGGAAANRRVIANWRDGALASQSYFAGGDG